MLTRRINYLVVLGSLGLLCMSCAEDPSLGYLPWLPGIDQKTGTKTDILARMAFGDDEHPGSVFVSRKSPHGFKRFEIAIKNESSQDLTDCVIIFDDRYKSALKDRYLGNPFGGSRLPKGKEIGIPFNYDLDNHVIFLDKDVNVDWRQIPSEERAKLMMDRRKVPKKLTLQHAMGIIDWDLTQATNHPAKKSQK